MVVGSSERGEFNYNNKLLKIWYNWNNTFKNYWYMFNCIITITGIQLLHASI